MTEKNITNIVVGEIATNCWIYPLSGQNSGAPVDCAIIDPGADADKIISAVKQLNYTPKFILLTHGHFDHIAALPDLFTEYNKGSNGENSPQIAICRGDSKYLGPASYEEHCKSFAAAAGNSVYIDRFWKDMPDAHLLLEEGDTVGPFSVLHVPGHTPGSIAFWDKEAKNLFTGDTLFYYGYGRTDLPGGNQTELVKSLKRIFAMDGNIRVFPGHGSATTVGAEAGRTMI